MELRNNLIFKSKKNDCEYRILCIDYICNILCIINMNEKEMPITIEKDDFYEKFGEEIVEIEEFDYKNIVDEKYITQKDKKIRDERYEIIENLLKCIDYNILNKKALRKAINDISEKSGKSKRSIKKYFIRYLCRGQVKNALLPDFYKCGGENKLKTLGDKKIGHPGVSIQGINTTNNIKEIFFKSYNEFYYKKLKENNEIKKTTAYKMMLDKYFRDENGNLKNENELPSLRQFSYWLKKEEEKDIEKYIKSTYGEKKYNLKYRPLLSDSMQDALYPSSIFQIDSTKGDIRLVSRYDSSLKIGRPTIYLIVDVYSRMITGFYVGVENASWICVMMALYSCTINKVELCKEWGIDISESEWNSRDLPDALLADRGTEFTGNNIDNLVNKLNIVVKNTSPFRADLKGIVERCFKEINEKFKELVPGAIFSPVKERGEKDPDKFACLNIIEINRIVIKCILNHNNKLMESYKRDTEMIEDNIKSIPTHIWEWGMNKKVGCKERFSEKTIKLALMPTGKARVTKFGIKFKNVFYVCKTAENEQWFTKARMYKTWTVDICFDPRNMNTIYLIKDKGRDFEICKLKESEERYFDKTFEEVQALIEFERNMVKNNRMYNIEKDIEMYRFINNEVHNAKRRKAQSTRENKQMERDANRSNEVFNLDDISEESKQQKNNNSEKSNTIVNNKKYKTQNNMYSSKVNKRINDKLKKVMEDKFNDKNKKV